MLKFNLSHLAALADAQLIGSDLTIEKVSSNSKDCALALFVALKGERFDGHDFIDQAIEAGAIAIVSQKKLDNCKVPYILCKDSLRAYGLCGLLVRQSYTGNLCSITGSCGKTTVKEMTAAILSTQGKTLYTQANFNNDVGVPLTLLRLDNSYKYAVIEQGASHMQDIARTCEFTQSKLALINNVGIAHVEGFGSKFNVYKGKSEILDAVFKNDGIGIVPADSEYFTNWQQDYAKEFKAGKLLSFGYAQNADIKLSNVTANAQTLSFDLSYLEKSVHIQLDTLGKHNALNAAAAAALALQQGFSLDQIKEGLEHNYKGIGQRLNIVRTKPFILIDDAYNASFNAVEAAIETLSSFNGFKVLIFADMLELGSEAVESHKAIGKLCDNNIDLLLCYGPLSIYAQQSTQVASKHFNLKADLLKYVHDLVLTHQNVVILVKGSHSMGLTEVVTYLQNI